MSDGREINILKNVISDKNMMADQLRTHVTDLLEAVKADLYLLKLAVDNDDPSEELKIRISDLEKRIAKGWLT